MPSDEEVFGGKPVEQPTAAPQVGALSDADVMASPKTQRSVMDQLLGLTGPRHQLPPEKVARELGSGIVGMVKDIPTLPKRMIQAAASAPPGSRQATEAMIPTATEAATLASPVTKFGRLIPKKIPPTMEQIFQRATAEYGGVNLMNLETTNKGITTLVRKIQDALIKPTQSTEKRYYEEIAPKTHAIVTRLGEQTAEPKSIGEVEAFRQTLNMLRKNPDNIERGAANRAIDAIDDWMANLQAEHVKVPAGTAKGNEGQIIAKLLENARGNWSMGKLIEEIKNAKYRGELQAGSAGSGANLDNALRQRLKSFILSKTKSQGLRPEERRMAEKTITGSTPANVARLVGKLAPSHPVSGWFPALAALFSGDMGLAAGMMASGQLGKTLAERSTQKGFKKLEESLAKRSPLYRTMPPSYQRSGSLTGQKMKDLTIRDLVLELGKQNAPQKNQ